MTVDVEGRRGVDAELPGEAPAGQVAMQSITTTRKVATAGVLVGLLALAARRG